LLTWSSSSVSIAIVRPEGNHIDFVSTPSNTGRNLNESHLLRIIYTRVQKESPDFLTTHEGIDQNIDIKMSTLVFRAAPAPVLALYDFVMSTFVPKDESNGGQIALRPSNAFTQTPEIQSVPANEIRVSAKLEGIQGQLDSLLCCCVASAEASIVVLINGLVTLATISLSTADVMVFVRPRTLLVTGRLGNLVLTNENQIHGILDEFNQIMSIQGRNFADFRYQTFDPNEGTYTGTKSLFCLNAGSIKFNLVEQPLHDLYLFVVDLAKLKGLYDAATQVAAQRASEMERIQFEVSVKTPIIVFPSNPSVSRDVLVMRLGQIGASNTSDIVVNKIVASLHGIQLISNLQIDGELSTLKIIDDIDITADIVQTSGIDRHNDNEYPDTQVCVFPVSRFKPSNGAEDCSDNFGREVTPHSSSIRPLDTIIKINSKDIHGATRIRDKVANTASVGK
jgi:vacuolar protein sorting-associated protein 13A/C